MDGKWREKDEEIITASLETIDGLPEEAVEFLTSRIELLQARWFHVHFLL